MPMSANVLFIIIDQFRADCLNGALANAVQLPNLRGLMGQGVTFNRHYTVTTPCGPSRASLLTGLYAMNHRSIRNGAPLDGRHPTIGTEFRNAGYEPQLFGYTDAAADPANYHPNDPVLKDYEGLSPGMVESVRMRQGTDGSWRGYLKTKGYEVPERFWDLYRPIPQSGSNTPAISDPALYRAEDSDTAFLTDRTLEQLRGRDAQNWFALVTYIRPHPPLVAPAPYNKLYAPANLPPPVRPDGIDVHRACHPFFAADHSEPSNTNLFIGHGGLAQDLSDSQISELRAVYFGLATEVDHHIGRLLAYIKDSGQADNTLVVVTADHGETLGDHHMWGKSSPFESALNVPLIIRDPRRRSTAGTQIDAFTETIDIAPTLLDWAGATAPPGWNGRSLLPFLDGQPPKDWRAHMFAEIDLSDPIVPTRFQRALGLPSPQCNFAVLRDEQFKYVHFNGGLPPLLYDMTAAPDAQVNLANDPDYQSTRLDYAVKMLDHRMTHAHHALSRMKLTKEGVKSGWGVGSPGGRRTPYPQPSPWTTSGGPFGNCSP